MNRLKDNVEAETLETLDQRVLDGISLTHVKIVSGQIDIGGSVADDMISNDQNRMGNSHGGTLLARNPKKLHPCLING
jgi:hypothetical protein